MKIKELLILSLIYILLLLAGTVLYVLSFQTFLFSEIAIFFYRGITIILFWGVVLAVIMSLLKYFFFKKIITIRDILLLLCTFCCVNIVIFTHLPVTADRSITVFMLGFMVQTEASTYTKQDLEEIFISKYVYEYGAFDKRLEEQIFSGTIKKSGDQQYQITEKGRNLIRTYEKVADWFLIDKKLIRPDISGAD